MAHRRYFVRTRGKVLDRINDRWRDAPLLSVILLYRAGPALADILAPLSVPLLRCRCLDVPHACRLEGFVFMRLT